MKARRNRLRIAGVGVLALFGISLAHAQDGSYPDKPVTVISDAAAGSSPDVATRFAAEGLNNLWRQQVVLINRCV